ncbi:unnamed protein product [Fraxinus pennsylvanica]|uniref:RNA polymerase Rpb1 domain-containing protein n=1 Tax=Fraxinus pennsylvanica TaxID=56036 RepID=A0AAD2A126_9LAMI|nr:unnamed protein product [Fraxinus pennsylvanica]
MAAAAAAAARVVGCGGFRRGIGNVDKSVGDNNATFEYLKDVTSDFDTNTWPCLGVISNDLIQFLYGEDGMDAVWIESQPLKSLKLKKSGFNNMYRYEIDDPDWSPSYMLPEAVEDLKTISEIRSVFDAEVGFDWKCATKYPCNARLQDPRCSPCFGIYMCGLVFEDLIAQRGLKEKKNVKRTHILYDTMMGANGSLGVPWKRVKQPRSKWFFRCPVEKSVRSLMNVPFTLAKLELEAEFVKEAAKEKMM